jgi:hypothetical protein
MSKLYNNKKVVGSSPLFLILDVGVDE